MQLDEYLKLPRCPHCSIDNPNLKRVAGDLNTNSDDGRDPRIWKVYMCGRCGGLVTASARSQNREVQQIFPAPQTVDNVLPTKVKAYLQQAIDSVSAPSGAVMLCASAVDAMLKEKSYKTGSLYQRIEKAIKDGILTTDMGKWAHQIRLDANDERHADEEATLPSVEEARQAIEFTKTLGEILFVLPSRVSRGLAETAVAS